MSVGRLRCIVIDVDDLAIAERFWSQMTGLPVITSNYIGRFSYLGQPDPWRHEIILQLVTGPKRVPRNRCHVDLTVDDVDHAIEQIARLGGTVKKEPSIYPRPGSFLADHR